MPTRQKTGDIGLTEAQKEAARRRLAMSVDKAVEVLRAAVENPAAISQSQLRAARTVLEMSGIITQQPRRAIPPKVLEAIAIAEASGLLEQVKRMMAEHDEIDNAE